jgi:hypothetical protein
VVDNAAVHWHVHFLSLSVSLSLSLSLRHIGTSILTSCWLPWSCDSFWPMECEQCDVSLPDGDITSHISCIPVSLTTGTGEAPANGFYVTQGLGVADP